MILNRTIKFFLKILWIATGVLSFYSEASFAQKAYTKLKVLSYNIHHCNPPSKAKEGVIDINAIAQVIKSSKADLVALQEVDVNTKRSGKGVNQARELGRLTGMYFYFTKTIDVQGGEYGVAILSKLPILDSAFYRLPMQQGAGGEARGMAVVKVKLKNGSNLLFASTHLDLTPANRELQAGEISRIFREQSLPVILAGDFNAEPGKEALNVLDKDFLRTCINNCEPTFPQINPKRVIDFIMFRKPDQFKVLSHKVINEPYASDHLPIMSKLKLIK